MTPTTTPAPSRREQLKARQQAETQRDKRRRTWTRIIGALVTVIVVAVVGYGLWTAIPEQGDTQRLAPDFTLTTTAGTSVTLSDQRPNPVLIYFNEGAGCASCTMQMAEIEKEAILTALQASGGNRRKAAERLDIGLRTLQRKLKEYRGETEGDEGEDEADDDGGEPSA